MVEEENFENKIVFKCMKCGWLYKEIENAEKCEEWCKNHNSCNPEITKFAIKPMFSKDKMNNHHKTKGGAKNER
jgi:hypothetical protein